MVSHAPQKHMTHHHNTTNKAMQWHNVQIFHVFINICLSFWHISVSVLLVSTCIVHCVLLLVKWLTWNQKLKVEEECRSREIVRNVYRFMKNEADRKTWFHCVNLVNRLLWLPACLCGQFLFKKELEAPNVTEKGDPKSFSTPNKNHKRSRPVTDLDDFDKCVVRRLVYGFYLTEKWLPTIKLLWKSLKENINFNGSEKSVWVFWKNFDLNGRQLKQLQNISGKFRH